MFFQRYYLDCLSHASYMIGDEQTKSAVVVDPQRDIAIYEADAVEHGLTIKHVVLTHFHADFVSGHIELRDRFGAQIYFGAKAEAEFEFHPLHDGDQIDLGSVRLHALETPGHTPEGLSLLVYDDSFSTEQPYAVLTGDTLFLGDVGRPDLLASIGVTSDELATMLYHSLHDKLLKLPDETLVYPAHGAGSMCGKDLSDAAVSTLGEQRATNYALQPMSQDDFIAMVTTDLPEAPAYFGHDAVLNRQERPSLDSAIAESMKALPIDDVMSLASQGAQLVDVRDPIEFAGAHLKGSLNIGIDGKYATWAGTMLDKVEPIVVIADEDRVEEAITRLGRIGFDHVRGYLKGGMSVLSERPELVVQTRRISPSVLAGESQDSTIIDVRSEKEWSQGHLHNSLNIPLNQLGRRLSEIPRDGQVIVHCQGGYRSSIAASLLQKHGWDDVIDLIGGYKAWTTLGLPADEVESSTSTCSLPGS